MIKKLLYILISTSLAFCATNIDKKIEKNQEILNQNLQDKKKTTLKIKELADQIEEQNTNIINLEKDIKSINADIDEHQKLLEESISKLDELKNASDNLIQEKKTNEEDIVDTIIEEFSISIALKLASENSLQELIDSEIYTLLSQNSKDKILKLNNSYDIISSNSKDNQKNIDKISSYIKEREKTKNTLNSLKDKRSKSLGDLEKQHKSYQEELTKVVEQQDSLKKLLSDLNIMKEEESKKVAEEERRKQEREAQASKKETSPSKNDDNQLDEIQTADVRNQQYAKNLNLDVRKIGSSTDGISIVKYKGPKTIAPLKSFSVVKNFGTYYDPVYKIKLFNESIVLKSDEPKAKVVSVLNGKVVYAKKNAGMLENVVIIQHENGLHTIYSHLDEIAPTLQVGKWVKQGYVVGRVDDSLMFQATQDSAHIDPKDLFKI